MVLNLLTVLQVFLGIVVTIGLYFLFSDEVTLPQMLGVYYGAVTNTPGLGATQEALDLFQYAGGVLTGRKGIAFQHFCFDR